MFFSITSVVVVEGFEVGLYCGTPSGILFLIIGREVDYFLRQGASMLVHRPATGAGRKEGRMERV